jgi:phage shock protein A
VSSWERELERRELRERLARAAAEEHRLHQRGASERQAERRWRDRAELAAGRELAALALEALERADEHARRASNLEVEFEQQRAFVERLRQAVRYPGAMVPRAGVAASLLAVESGTERRLAQLERDVRLERDLAELKQRRAPAQKPAQDGPTEGAPAARGAGIVGRDPA